MGSESSKIEGNRPKEVKGGASQRQPEKGKTHRLQERLRRTKPGEQKHLNHKMLEEARKQEERRLRRAKREEAQSEHAKWRGKRRQEEPSDFQQPTRHQQALPQASSDPCADTTSPPNADLQPIPDPRSHNPTSPTGVKPQPTPELFFGLQVASLGDILDRIVDNAYKSLQIIEFWRQASSDQPTVSGIIKDIRDLGVDYFDAIDVSIHTAEDGYGFSSDAVYLCGLLLNSETNEEDLRHYIQDMKGKAKLALGKCTKALNNFRDVRKRLIEIMKRIPEVVRGGDETELSIHVADEGGHERDAGLVDAMNEFKAGLGTLSEVVDKFAEWWDKMETELKDADEKGSHLKPGENKVRVKQVQKIWLGVKEEYLQYKTKVFRLQDHYPSLDQHRYQKTQAQTKDAHGAPRLSTTVPHLPVDLLPTPGPGFVPSGAAPNTSPNVDPQPTPVSVLFLPVSPPRGILDTIVDNAYQSMQIIEPWRQASSDNPILSKIIQDIHGLSLVYFDAIDASIQTAQDGYGFSRDAVYLCGLLLDSETKEEDLRQYIQDMKNKATLAWEKCTHTVNKFRVVRRGLNEITKSVPEEVREDDKANLSVRTPVFGDDQKRERDTGLVDALEELSLTALKLGTLSDGINTFSEWWVGMETTLKDLEIKGSGLRPGKDKGRLKQVREGWLGVQDDYLQYKDKIIMLQDYYPSQAQALETG